MFGHWYVVASQKTATIFTENSEIADSKATISKTKIPKRGDLIKRGNFNRSGFKTLKVFDNPLGRERNRALIRKQAGRGMKSVGRGTVHYSETKRHDPHEEASIQFAKEITQYLKKENQRKKFKSLTIAAEPHFLGKIRSSMDEELQSLVTEWINKDFQKIPPSQLPKRLMAERGAVIE